MNKKFLLTILTLSAFLLADNHMGKNDISNKMWAKMKMDLAELKGPPSVSEVEANKSCLLYTSPSPRDGLLSRMPSSA